MIDLVFDANAGWVKGWVSPTGFAMLAILFIMGVFAHRSVRKSGHFELFYWTHLLFVAFFVLMILHGPNVWKWLVAPLCLYAMEVLYKVWYNCSDRGKTYVSSVLILPNQVLRLKIDRPPDFDFLAGDYVYLNIPQVAKMEWHPFTISSAPEDEEFLTLHIRVAGGWTSKLYEICQRDAERLVKEKSIQKLRSKLNPFRSRLTYAYRKTTGGRENLAFQPDSTLPPSTRAEAGISFGTPYRTTKEDAKEFAPPEMPILIDGPYGGCAVGVWKTPYVVLIAGGIGVTPFASLLQSLVNRYQSAMSPCPHCSKPCCTNVPASMGRMRHVDFIWVNRDLLSFQWFLELMLDLDREQAVGGSIMQQFLNIQLYQTEGKTLHESYKPCKSCSETLPGAPKVENDPPAMDSSVSIQIRKPPVGGQCPYCMLRQMNHLLHYGRPVWDEVFEEVAIRSAGRVTVFYCGPRGMGNEIRTKCRKYGFTFTKEIF